jgi:colanic acid/amylovoran biosynthesis protein
MKILIKNFPNLNNYGTGMMGLITIQYLINKYGSENIEVYCAFDEYANIEDICKELPEPIQLNIYINKNEDKISKIKNPISLKLNVLFNMFFARAENKFDMVVVLGGDDFSEFYSKYIASIELYKLWRYSKHSKVIMLGQTIGPFSNFINRFVFKHLLPKINVYARDPWSVEYSQKNFNVKIKQIGDLAFNPLPLQGDSILEDSVLEEYGLTKNNYFTVVISGLFNEGYYCNNENTYLLRHREIIIEALKHNSLRNKKVVLLAHTFPPYGDESLLIERLYEMFSQNEKENIIIIKDKIFPTKARFVLGNGIFTVTGRMHPAVSTFQMGKPAISLSYSPKYYGVLGQSINRSDLIIDANESNKWLSGEIVSLVDEKVRYLLDNYTQIVSEIKSEVEKISKLNEILINKIL